MLIKLTVCCKPNGIGHGCVADCFHCFRINSNKTAGVCSTVQHGKDQHPIVHAFVVSSTICVFGGRQLFALQPMINLTDTVYGLFALPRSHTKLWLNRMRNVTAGLVWSTKNAVPKKIERTNQNVRRSCWIQQPHSANHWIVMFFLLIIQPGNITVNGIRPIASLSGRGWNVV